MSEKLNRSVRIPSIDAKDIYLANHLIDSDPKGYSLIHSDGTVNLRKFLNVLDYSLDLIQLREVYQKVYNNKRFSFEANGYEHTDRVINVTFKYSVKEYNLAYNNVYVRNGYRLTDFDCLADNVFVENDKLIAIRVGEKVETPADTKILGDNFVFEDNSYKIAHNATVHTVAELRKDLYINGFYCNGTHYVRFKRSSGSSRVGKCLFIDEKLYPRMHKYEMCRIKVKQGDEIDLAALEAYISLTLSSIIDTIEIDPKSILIIKDYESTFKDTVIVTKNVNGKLVTGEEKVSIANSIWDGQSLIDTSIFPEHAQENDEHAQHGMILLRNHFFKSCAFNTNIQKFFEDNNITKIEQLNGITLAEDVSQIKLITTPSSVKYIKFGTAKAWLKSISPTFGIVKHEKKTHFFDGDMVQTHYQLLNTLQMSYEEMQKFLKPSIDYMNLLKTNPAVLRWHVHLPGSFTNNLSNEWYWNSPQSFKYLSKNDIVFKLLGLNEDFVRTKLYRDFVTTCIQGYKDNILYGHVLVNGNYSTLFGNSLEMLYQSIGKFKGESVLGIGNVYSKRFEDGERLLGSRSPHVCVGNILLATNVKNVEIDKYFNLTKEIVCINSIKENILQRLSGAD